MVGLERWKLEPVAARELSGMLQHHPLSLRLALGGLNQETLPSGPLFSLLVRELRTRLGQVSHLGGERRWVMAAAGLCTARLSENALQVGRAAAVLPTAGFSMRPWLPCWVSRLKSFSPPFMPSSRLDC